ncbi:MAG TPA: hypothetical protein VG893_04035 [Terracidiphilus sp.]|nr:hypothetical protein [Terracidiphilus sp.]
MQDDITPPARGSTAAQATDDEQGRLRKLVGELVTTNQELRFKLAQLEQRLDEAGVAYRLLMP